MSELDETISKIRCGEVILWVGSGFSKLAGYPSGSELARIIKNKLRRNEKQYVKNRFNLDDVTEEFVQIRSREELISILNEVFKKEPTNLMLHEMVSKIPQIQTIITTNYDKSFELAYGTDIFTILNDKDVPTSVGNKVNLYKIHGDIDVPDSIIITKKDYSDYYKEQKENLLWNEIRSLVSKYSILFIGYSFEDSNIKSVFEDVLERLGESHKDYYLITRDLPDHKRCHLSDKYSIRYIKMSAEDAISNIRKEVEKHLIIDAENGYIPKHLTKKIFEERKINPKFSIIEEGKLNLETITSLEGGPQIEFDVSLTAPTDKISTVHEFKDIICGNKFDECVLSQDKCKINISAKIGECLLFDPKNSDVSSLTVTSTPNRSISADLLLPKSCFLFNNLKGEHYFSCSAFTIKIFHSGFDLIIKSLDATKPEFNIHFSIHEVKSVAQGYQVYSFFNTWIEEDELQIYFDFSDKPFTILFSKLHLKEKEVQKIRVNYDLYSKLFRVQREFGVVFSDLSQITDDDFHYLNKIIYLLDGGKSFLDNISCQLKIMNENGFLRILEDEIPVSKFYPIIKEFKILGIQIVLLCAVYVYDGFIVNKNEVASKLEEGYKEVNVTIASKNDTLFLVYNKELLNDESVSHRS
ncbi:SIR2 family protein [Methanosarcina sp. Mfa9]|uniref:SIR2 family protein n=1 Tax=Methanosarcina sp. Mfa9 TaxID=3439063 RepID=UPI003F8308DD